MKETVSYKDFACDRAVEDQRIRERLRYRCRRYIHEPPLLAGGFIQCE